MKLKVIGYMIKSMSGIEKACGIAVILLIVGISCIFFHVVSTVRAQSYNEKQAYTLLAEYKEKNLETEPNMETITDYRDRWGNRMTMTRTVKGDVTEWVITSDGKDLRYDTNDDFCLRIDNEPIARKAGKLFSGLKKEFDKGIEEGTENE